MATLPAGTRRMEALDGEDCFGAFHSYGGLPKKEGL